MASKIKDLTEIHGALIIVFGYDTDDIKMHLQRGEAPNSESEQEVPDGN